ncbi:MAG: response regulator [Phototrophicaceae bacterium]
MALAFQFLNKLVGVIAEDDVHSNNIMVALLKANGVSVHTAYNGQEAWLTIQELPTPPDFIITDLSMPILNGWELIEKIRADEQYAKVPIVVLSAHTDREAMVQAIAAGADQFLNKPIRPVIFTNDLVKLIQEKNRRS